MSTSPELILTEESAGFDPLVLFNRWLIDAETLELVEPHAMVLATANARGEPSARVVLLRGYDEHGFTFYTNYASRKGEDLADNPRAALIFYWDLLRRQVRISGTVTRVSAEESDVYFRGRPLGHKLSSSISPQSQVVSDRHWLETTLAELAHRYQDCDVPRPPNWGGYRVAALEYEFWQGRDNRLHDRLRYRKRADSDWQRDRLAP